MDVQNVRKNGWEGALPPAEMWMPGSLVQGIDAACLRASKEGADGSQQKGELRCMEYSSHGHLKKQERHPPRQTSRGRQDPKEVGNGEMQGCKIKLVLGSLHKTRRIAAEITWTARASGRSYKRRVPKQMGKGNSKLTCQRAAADVGYEPGVYVNHDCQPSVRELQLL
eukprot:scaffold162998_cov17-Tisochrysis_lutea.AAC.1